MTALEAALVHEQIGHSKAWAGLFTGAVAGLAIAGAALFIVGTGGVGAVFIGAGLAAATAGGALGGAYIGEAVSAGPKGPIQTGSPDTLAGPARRSLVRAGLDMVLCADDGPKLVAQGSVSVYVNGKQLARKSEKTACSGVIREGLGTLLVGGETATAPGVTIEAEIPPWLINTLTAVMWGGALLATGGAAGVVGAGLAWGGFFGSLFVGFGFGRIGGQIGRVLGGELGARIGEVVGGFVGGLFGTKLGAHVGRRVAPKPGTSYPGQSARSNAAMDEVMSVLESKNVRKTTVGVVPDRDGTVTVALSGDEATTLKEYAKIRDALPKNFKLAPPSTKLPLEPVRRWNLKLFTPGRHCVEAKLSGAMQRNPEGMTVRRWKADPPKQHRMRGGNHPRDMRPCLSCVHNEHLIVTTTPLPKPPPTVVLIEPRPGSTDEDP